VKSGDFSVRLPGQQTGIAGKIADTFNDIVAANQRMAEQLDLVGNVVGREGRTRQRIRFGLQSGAWAGMEDSANALIDDLLWSTREVKRVIGAVAKGDLLQTVALEATGRPLAGEFLRSAKIVNAMIEQLSVFPSEVTRVAREAGADGRLGGYPNPPASEQLALPCLAKPFHPSGLLAWLAGVLEASPDPSGAAKGP
jgi:methyl-accepting chemotaxis protein